MQSQNLKYVQVQIKPTYLLVEVIGEDFKKIV